MPYVRVKTSARHSIRLRRVSLAARGAFCLSLMLAEDCACDGVAVGSLSHPELGPMTLAEIADDLHISEKEMAKIADELVTVSLWTRDDSGAYAVTKFESETTPADPRSAERVRKYRERNAKKSADVTVGNAVTVTPDVTDGNGVTPSVTSVTVTPQSVECRGKSESSESKDSAAEIEKYEAPPFPGIRPSLPEAVDDLKRVSVPFLAAFCNATSPEALAKHGPAYVDVLAAMRGRGWTTAEAWKAFSDARSAANGRPLFNRSAKNALNYTPTRPKSNVTPIRGADFDALSTREKLARDPAYIGSPDIAGIL